MSVWFGSVSGAKWRESVEKDRVPVEGFADAPLPFKSSFNTVGACFCASMSFLRI